MYRLCHTERFGKHIKSEELIRALEDAADIYQRHVSIQRKPGRIDYDPTKKRKWRFKQTQYGLEFDFKLPNSNLLVRATPLAQRDNPWKKGSGIEELYTGLRFYRQDYANARATGRFARELGKFIDEVLSEQDIPF